MTAAFGRAAVLGLGLIGGSLLHAIRQSGLDVVGYDIDTRTAAAASSSGFPVTASDASAVHGADLIVLAMPLPEVAGALRSLAPHLAPAAAAAQDAAVARVIGLPHVLAEALAVTGLSGGPLGLSLAAGSYMSGSRVARTRPEMVATWCDANPSLVGALDDVIGLLHETREQLANAGTVFGLASAGYHARMSWEERMFEPVELPSDPAALLAHGRSGGWITAVLRDDDGLRLLGMRPAT
jgi:prephenate dehydrogenase